MMVYRSVMMSMMTMTIGALFFACSQVQVQAQGVSCASQLQQCAQINPALTQQIMELKSTLFAKCTPANTRCQSAWRNYGRCSAVTLQQVLTMPSTINTGNSGVNSAQLDAVNNCLTAQSDGSAGLFSIIGASSSLFSQLVDGLELSVVDGSLSDVFWGLQSNTMSSVCPSAVTSFLGVNGAVDGSVNTNQVSSSNCELSTTEFNCVQESLKSDQTLNALLQQQQQQRLQCVKRLKSADKSTLLENCKHQPICLLSPCQCKLPSTNSNVKDSGQCSVTASRTSLISCLCNARQQLQRTMQADLRACMISPSPTNRAQAIYPYLNQFQYQTTAYNRYPYNTNSFANTGFNSYYQNPLYSANTLGVGGTNPYYNSNLYNSFNRLPLYNTNPYYNNINYNPSVYPQAYNTQYSGFNNLNTGINPYNTGGFNQFGSGLTYPYNAGITNPLYPYYRYPRGEQGTQTNNGVQPQTQTRTGAQGQAQQATTNQLNVARPQRPQRPFTNKKLTSK